MVGRQGTEVLHLLLQARTDLIQWVMLALAAALGALLTLLIPLLLHRAGAFLSRRVGRSFREGSLRRVAARTQPVLPHATGPLQHLTDPIPLEQVFVVPPLILRQPSSANVPTAIRWWIVGGPGSGKTTLLQMLALRWSEAVRGRPQGLLALLRTLAPADRVPAAATFTAQLPFYLSAAHYQPHLPLGPQLAGLLYRISRGALSLPADQVERWLQQGRCALLVDDLGQTDRPDAEAALLEALEELAARTRCSIVIAGNNPALRLEGFDGFDLAPWSDPQIQTLIERWQAALGRRKGPALPDPQALLSALRENAERWELARQPGFLSGLLALAVQSGGLPARRSALYAQLVPILMDRPQALPPEEDLPASLKRTALEHLAWAMRWLRRSSLPVGFIEEDLSDLLRQDPRLETAQVHAALSWLRERCGLITPGSTIAFRHPAFASALIAQSALADPSRQAQLLQQAEEPEWQEALVMLAGLSEPAAARRLLTELLEPEDDFFYTRTRLAGRCLMEAPHLQTEIRDAIVGRLRTLLTEAPYSFLQQEAASILAGIPGQLEWLADQLRRPDLPFSARAAIVEAIAREQGPRAVGLLALALRDDRIPLPIREQIAEHLGHLGDPAIARDLLDLIGDESLGVELRRKVVMAIARIGDRSLGPALVEHLGLPWLNPIVRETLLDALRTLGDSRVVEELVPLIRDPDLPLELRRRMIETATALAEASHLETLLTLAEDPNLEVSLRAAIVNGLAEAGFRELGPWLIGLLREGPRHRLRARVSTWILRSGSPFRPWLERLGRRLGLAGAEQEEFARLLLQRQAIIALGRLKEARAVPLLLRILQDPQAHPSLRALVPDALAAIGALRVVPQLLEVLRDRHADSTIRERIALALGAMRASAAIPALLERLRDPTEDPFIQARAALAIGLIRDPSVASELIPLLRAENLPVTARRAIADALGTLRAREVVRSLIQLLPDERIPSSVRQAIAETLGVLGAAEIGEELMWLARDERIDPHVRGAIALTLATLHHRPAAPEILAMLPDVRIDPAIRQALAESLGNLWDPTLIAPLARLLLESALDLPVRQGILRTLERHGGPEAFPTFWILVRNPETPMPLRRAAADALVTCAGPEFEETLLTLALDPEMPPYIQGRALEALRRVGNDPDTVQALIRALPASEMPNAVFLTVMEIAQRARVRLLLRETLSRSAPEEGHLRPPEGEGRSAG
jgi:HEAT repeat protein